VRKESGGVEGDGRDMTKKKWMTAFGRGGVWCTRWRLYNYVEPSGFVDVLQVKPGELTMLFLDRAGQTSGQLLGCGCALELLAIEEDCVVVEVEILVSWPAGRRQRTCGSPRGDSELSDSLRHCLDEEGCECCGYGVYGDIFWDFGVGDGWRRSEGGRGLVVRKARIICSGTHASTLLGQALPESSWFGTASRCERIMSKDSMHPG